MPNQLEFAALTPKSEVFDHVREYLAVQNFAISDYDDQRPWGGFFYVDEAQSARFIETFFPHLNVSDFAGFARLSPKILLVAPGKRLSWQYHFRRSEIWKLIGGRAAVVVSDTDAQTPERSLLPGDIVTLRQGERHRLVGTDTWGVVAEIWQHTDAANPSDEDDIVRVEDDFGR
jgi:mannose-6-phosphate isomerase-like protein (cupin superfamily)